MKLSVIATSVLLAAVSTGAYAYTPGTYTAAIAGQNGRAVDVPPAIAQRRLELRNQLGG